MALSEERKLQIEQEVLMERTVNPSPNITKTSSGSKSSLPALLSFFIPGLGQLVKGQVGRGLLFFFGTIVGLAMLVVPGVIVWILNIRDAYNK